MNKITKVRGIAVLGGKLLCVKLKPYYPGAAHAAREFWCLPGGTIEDGEPVIDAFRREMVEELGVEAKVGRLLFVHQFAHNGIDFTEFLIHIENPEDYANIDLSKTTHGNSEIKEIAFVDPKTSTILPEFLTTENLPELIASNQPVKFFAG